MATLRVYDNRDKFCRLVVAIEIDGLGIQPTAWCGLLAAQN